MLTQDVRNALDVADLNKLKYDLNSLQPVDVGEYISELPEQQRAIAFRLLNKNQAIDVFEYLPTDVQEELINSLHDVQVVHLVEEMSPDERAYLFDELPAGVVKRLLQQLSPEQRQATATILGYPEGTAGRVMTTEYVRLRQGLTVGEALSKIRLQDEDKETIYYAYVTDDNRKLVSVVSLRQLLFTFPEVFIRDIASSQVVKVTTETSQEEVARIMQRYDLIAIPVVDREDRLVGIITIDDVVDILQEEATEDIQKLAAVSGDEEALSPPHLTIRKRLPWLLGIMALYIGAASAIAPFQRVIAAVPVLAVIMPIFSNTGGTVGIQALTVTIRGLGVGEVTTKDAGKILRKELIAGLGTALALGSTMILLSLIWAKPDEKWVALIAGVVMATNTMVAVSLGTLLPMGLQRLKLDPALMSGPLVTTMLDTIGFLTFLSMISLALKVFNLSY
ncbi:MULTISPECIES: magnesium transporter [Cylindrospermopsis]|uniref:magnesium transporter n=1 Tax=Cylindrospermopsis TaxID=77021 RepID=UPI00070F9C8B|nr:MULTISPECIES: magnesium transporter [Cylindrospermopsis]MBU6345337.1 magnesium transporter [Cyanobacteria bacterium REEB494]KRH97812.1 Mg2+ transporter [Cylindrospermopsis sp. CR12]TPX28141.1 magnesium transporter [Cylindrospermopsis raciborskii GIHE 2018]UJL34555.1 magnesium transporter [Cylindrospermopsis raciborskii Cr2010]UJS04076.1 magnesium transporter [Cylindrospermopsis raciborskii KLL07]